MEMSPYKLLQEIYYDDPWKSMVCCILLNCTRRTQVNGVVEDLFRIYPNPVAMSKAPSHDLALILQPLGFHNKRAETLKRFSSEWLTKGNKPVNKLFGIGKYAHDSWKIFYENDLTLNPKDGVLVKYVEWKRQQPAETVQNPTATPEIQNVKVKKPMEQAEMTSLELKIIRMKELGIKVRIVRGADNGMPVTAVGEVAISESSDNVTVESAIDRAIEQFEKNNYYALLKKHGLV